MPDQSLTRSPCQRTHRGNCLQQSRAALSSFITPPYFNHLPRASHCVPTCPYMAGDQRSAWTLTLAPGSPLQRPIKELESGGVCWLWVVSGHGSVPLWQVRFLIGSEASQWSESSRYCPVWSERPRAERPGPDRVRPSTDHRCLSDVTDPQLHTDTIRFVYI